MNAREKENSIRKKLRKIELNDVVYLLPLETSRASSEPQLRKTRRSAASKFSKTRKTFWLSARCVQLHKTECRNSCCRVYASRYVNKLIKYFISNVQKHIAITSQGERFVIGESRDGTIKSCKRFVSATYALRLFACIASTKKRLINEKHVV